MLNLLLGEVPLQVQHLLFTPRIGYTCIDALSLLGGSDGAVLSLSDIVGLALTSSFVFGLLLILGAGNLAWATIRAITVVKAPVIVRAVQPGTLTVGSASLAMVELAVGAVHVPVPLLLLWVGRLVLVNLDRRGCDEGSGQCHGEELDANCLVCTVSLLILNLGRVGGRYLPSCWESPLLD